MGGENALIEWRTELRFQWEHVKSSSGAPYVVVVTYHNLVGNGLRIPHAPLRMHEASGLTYNIEFFDAFAENVLSGATYQGVVYDGAVIRYVRDVPHETSNALDAKAYWLLPSGTLRCMSARDFRAGPTPVRSLPSCPPRAVRYIFRSPKCHYLGKVISDIAVEPTCNFGFSVIGC